MVQRRTRRLPVMLTEHEASEIEEFRWAERLGSQAEAVRQLVRLGLNAATGEGLGNSAPAAATHTAGLASGDISHNG